MYVQDSGNKTAPTIVFIHGGGVSGWMWRKQVEHFSDFRCLVPDLPGHGKSREERFVSPEDCARKLAVAVEALAGAPVYIVGHSLGAKVAVEFLRIRPQLARRAVICSALYRPSALMSLVSNRLAYRASLWMLKSRKLLELQARLFNFPDEAYRQHFIEDTRHLTLELLEAIYANYKHPQLPAGLSEISTEVLAVAGQKELRQMRLSVADLASVLPKAQGALIRGAKHNFPWTHYEQLNRLIRQWIERGSLDPSPDVQLIGA